MALTQVQSGILADSTQTYGMKNRIINGDMRIDQRNNGAAVTVNSTANFYFIDRFFGQAGGGGVFTEQRSSIAPTGFVNSALFTVTTADSSIASGDIYCFSQVIEGFNTADLMFGTANAQTVTLSFWVRSSVTGTFGGALANEAFNRSYPFTYTINSANTFEYKTITIPGDTTGSWNINNVAGIRIYWGFGAGSSYSGGAGSWLGGGTVTATGSTNLMATNGATFYITGVQFEKGSTATAFDTRSYGTELVLCQRYYTRFNCGTAFGRLLPFALGIGGALVRPSVQLPVRMRTAASSVDFGGAIRWYNGSAVGTITSVSIDTANDTVIGLNCATSGASALQAYMINDSGDNTAYIGISAEL
jgi:hypothetical protein